MEKILIAITIIYGISVAIFGVYFNLMCRGSALRYLLTRTFDYLNTPKNAVIKIKDPKEYLQKLNFHRKLRSFKDYI